MAAIIAQLSRANRERKKNRVNLLPAEKSRVILMPFEQHFDPEKHNPYVRAKVQSQKRKREAKLKWIGSTFEEGEANRDRLEDLKKSYL